MNAKLPKLKCSLWGTTEGIHSPSPAAGTESQSKEHLRLLLKGTRVALAIKEHRGLLDGIKRVVYASRTGRSLYCTQLLTTVDI